MWRVRVDVRRRNESDAGERNGNRGGRGRGIVMQVVCERQSAGGAVRTTDDTLAMRAVGTRGILQSGMERKAEDRDHPRAIYEQSYQRCA